MKLIIEAELRHYEVCDSSGAIAVSENHFVVANDEDNLLRVYQSDQSGEPIRRIDINHYFDNNPEQKEIDLEAVAQIDDRIYWMTSHGRNKQGKFKAERHQFFANKVTNFQKIDFEQVGQSYTQLVLEDMLADKRLKQYNLEDAEQLPPKEKGGLNIEGLAATPDQELLIGFRNPIPHRKALLVPLKNPQELVEQKGAHARLGDPIELDLNGLGIRSIEYWPSQKIYMIVAGVYDGGDRFALYQWAGSDTKAQLIEGLELPSDFRPEGILFYRDRPSQFQLLSDDGSLVRSGSTPCKDIKDPNNPLKYFRSIWISVTDFGCGEGAN